LLYINQNGIFEKNISVMRGVTIMTEEKSGKRIAQLDLTHLSKHSEELGELFDMLIAEARKDEKETAWKDIKKDLKKKGRL
jgi:hypothetical protein